LCQAFDFEDLQRDPRLQSNNDRVRAREWLLPILRDRFAPFSASELAQRFEQAGLPYAPITKPHELFDDPHLLTTGGLSRVTLPADASAAQRPLDTHIALLPLAMDGQRLPVRHDPPGIGQDSRDLLQELGYDDDEIAQLIDQRVVGTSTPSNP
jgi:crotonobetainyl-CoA:carnitine CoA-transferase CaiB-like acyl-CoA transferase